MEQYYKMIKIIYYTYRTVYVTLKLILQSKKFFEKSILLMFEQKKTTSSFR